MTVLYRFTDAGLENEDLVYSDSLDQSLKALVVVVVNLLIFISVFNQIDAQNLFHNKFYFMPLHVSSTCAHHLMHETVTYWCDDTRGCIMQF